MSTARSCDGVTFSICLSRDCSNRLPGLWRAHAVRPNSVSPTAVRMYSALSGGFNAARAGLLLTWSVTVATASSFTKACQWLLSLRTQSSVVVHGSEDIFGGPRFAIRVGCVRPDVEFGDLTLIVLQLLDICFRLLKPCDVVNCLPDNSLWSDDKYPNTLVPVSLRSSPLINSAQVNGTPSTTNPGVPSVTTGKSLFRPTQVSNRHLGAFELFRTSTRIELNDGLHLCDRSATTHPLWMASLQPKTSIRETKFQINPRCSAFVSESLTDPNLESVIQIEGMSNH